MWKLVPMAISWFVWEERNRRIFDGIQRQPRKVLDDALSMIHAWLSAFSGRDCPPIRLGCLIGTDLCFLLFSVVLWSLAWLMLLFVPFSWLINIFLTFLKKKNSVLTCSTRGGGGCHYEIKGILLREKMIWRKSNLWQKKTPTSLKKLFQRKANHPPPEWYYQLPHLWN